MNKYKEDAVMYLYHKALSDRSKSEASLELLLENAVGIGDHTTADLYQELDKALDILVDSVDRLDILESKYGEVIDRRHRASRGSGTAPF